MLGQNQTMNESVQHVIEDEFDVLIPGIMLRTLEFADSRAFDDATTPQKLRLDLSLGGVLSAAAIDTLSAGDLRSVQTADFAPLSRLGTDLASGTVAGCDLENLMRSVRCDDISDLHTLPDSSGNEWRMVTLETSGGDPLEVEVRVEVNYVNIDAPDTPVSTPTFHKRVDVFARSPLLVKSNPGQQVRAHRVISYDPVVAAEYLRRQLVADMNKSLDDAANELTAAQEVERVAGEALNQARTLAERAQTGYDVAQNALNQLNTNITALEASVSAAQAALTAAQSATGSGSLDILQGAVTAAEDRFWAANDKMKEASDGYYNSKGQTRKDYRDAYWAAHADREAARSDYFDALNAVENYTPGGADPDAVAAAEETLTKAQADLAAAKSRIADAQKAVSDAQAALATANTNLVTARQAYDAATAALQQAIEAYEAAQRRADYQNGN